MREGWQSSGDPHPSQTRRTQSVLCLTARLSEHWRSRYITYLFIVTIRYFDIIEICHTSKYNWVLRFWWSYFLFISIRLVPSYPGSYCNGLSGEVVGGVGLNVRGGIKGHYKYTGIGGNTSLAALMGRNWVNFWIRRGCEMWPEL